MIELQLVQGSNEWLAHRQHYRNASDTPSVTGSSTYKSRAEFLKERATGVIAEVDAATQRRFDDGHLFEKLARPLMEKIIGEDLFPVVGVDGLYSASFDGLTMMGDTNGEHKTLNDAIRACQAAADLPLMYREQMEHQMMVSGAGRSLFFASKWKLSDDGEYVLEEEKHFWYEPDMALRQKICAAWDQFDADVATYVSSEVIPAAVASPVKDLPAVIYKMDGMTLTSNLPDFKVAALRLIEDSKKPMKTDQDFADRIELCKKFEEAEKKIELLQAQVVSEVHDVNAFCVDLGEISKLFRQARLAGTKLVDAEKTNRKNAILSGAKAKWDEHIADLNTRLGKNYMPAIAADFATATKGLKSMSSMQNAVDTLLANCKIAANETADKIDANLKTLRELAADYASLFADTPAIVQKMPEDLVALVKSRIADHKAEQERKEAADKADAERKAAEAQASKPALVAAQEVAVLSAKSVADSNARKFVDSTSTSSVPTVGRQIDSLVLYMEDENFTAREVEKMQHFANRIVMDRQAAA